MNMHEKAIIKIAGANAQKFLQGQLTADVSKLQPEQFTLAAHCNPQGRIVSLFYITTHDDAYYLFLPKSMAEIATNYLKKFAVFFKITPEMVTETPFTSQPNSLAEDIEKGIPAIYPETSGMFLPHELNLHLLNAVSFDKGCYTGQEIVARMHYKAKLKNHLYQASLKKEAAIAPGTLLYAKIGNKEEVAATLVDSRQESDDILLVCDENNAKNNHLYLIGNQNYVTFKH